jgi:hypothetical protein
MQVTFASAAQLFSRKPASPKAEPKGNEPKQIPTTSAGDSFVRFSGCCG